MKRFCQALLFALGLAQFFGCSSEQNPDVFPKEAFSVFEAKRKDGRLMVGSINMAYQDYGKKNDYPWCLKLMVALKPEGTDANGLPSAAESYAANRLEDSLTIEITKRTTAHYIGHVFNDQFLDIYFYLANPTEVNDYLKTQTGRTDLPREIAYRIEKDTAWSSVQAFLEFPRDGTK